jgi:hypothetical protein
MESSVRYIQLPNAGQKPALCFRGSKTAYAVINARDGVIRTVEINLKDYDKAQRVKSTKNGGEDYSPTAFAEAITRMSLTRVITARAKLLLEKGFSLSSDDTLLPEEEPMPTPKDEQEEDFEAKHSIEGAEEVAERPRVRKLPKKTREGKAKAEPAAKPAETGGAKRLNGSAGAPRQADRTPRPTPIAPLPSKPAGSAKAKTAAKASRGGSGKTLVSILASEAGLAQQPCRVKLRGAGLRAPYDEKNEAACRKALGLPVKKGGK